MNSLKSIISLIALIISLLIIAGCGQKQNTVDSFLTPVNGKFYVSLCNYDTTHELTHKKIDFENKRIKEESFAGALWKCSYTYAPVKENPEAMDIDVSFIITKGLAKQSAAEVDFTFDDWADSNYVLIPGGVYNGNRFDVLKMNYPPFFKDTKYWKADLPITVNDVPRLSKDKGLSEIESSTGDAATPAMGFRSGKYGKGFWVQTLQETRLHNSGMSIRENENKTQAVFSVSAPKVRKLRSGLWKGRVPSGDKAIDWKTGDFLNLHFRIYVYDAPRIQSIFDKFTDIRKDLSNVKTAEQVLPFGAAWEIQEAKHNQFDWRENKGYYIIGDGGYPDWQCGWVGGLMNTFPLIVSGSDLSVKHSVRNLETIIMQSQAPSGFLYGVGDGKKWESECFAKGEFPHSQHLIRKSGDAFYYFMLQYIWLEKNKPEYKANKEIYYRLQKMANAFADLWQKNKQFGQFVDDITGEIVVGRTCSGGIVPAALTLASDYFREPKYLTIAKEAARYYYLNFVSKGVTNGGPGEALQAPDSESAAALLESFMVLYEKTGEKEWLNYAKDMANQLATWVVSYNYHFPDNCTFSKMGMKTVGSVWANAQNRHAAPGLCTASGDCLLKLYRASGDIKYLDLLTDIAHNLPQYLSRADRLIPVREKNKHQDILGVGLMNERVQMSDWEAESIPVGEIFKGSCWSEVSLMLTWLEVPGVYVIKDKRFVRVIDHIEAKFIADKEAAIEIYNPTKFDTKVRLFAENDADRKTPLGLYTIANLKTIGLKAGERKLVKL